MLRNGNNNDVNGNNQLLAGNDEVPFDVFPSSLSRLSPALAAAPPPGPQDATNNDASAAYYYQDDEGAGDAEDEDPRAAAAPNNSRETLGSLLRRLAMAARHAGVGDDDADPIEALGRRLYDVRGDGEDV
jgi:hypothetical protein